MRGTENSRLTGCGNEAGGSGKATLRTSSSSSSSSKTERRWLEGEAADQVDEGTREREEEAKLVGVRSSEDSSTSQRVSMGWLGSTMGAGRRVAGRGIVYVRLFWDYLQAMSDGQKCASCVLTKRGYVIGYVMMGLGAVVGGLSSAGVKLASREG